MLSWVALAPLIYAILKCREQDVSSVLAEGGLFLGPATGWQGFLLGYVGGIIWYLGSCYWVYNTMHEYGGLGAVTSAILLLLYALYLALYHGLFGLLLALTAARRNGYSLRALVFAPFIWVAVELARTYITGFPWDLLGYTQIDNIPMTRIATFTGVYGLSFEIALVNTAVAAAFLVPQRKRPLLLAVSAVVIILLHAGKLYSPPALPTTHGVTLVRTSLELKDVTVEEVNAALERTVKASTELGKYKPDCIIFGGSPTVAVPGRGFEKAVVERIEKASGRKAFSAQVAAIEALQKHGARKLALATPFPDNVNAMVKEYLEKSGFEILSIRGSGVPYVDLTRTPLQKSWELGKRVFEEAKTADALYFPGAPQPCVDIIDALEKELDTFVISSLQATLWKGLQTIGYNVPIAGYGKLLRGG